jgi:hypothetical protein
MGRAAERGLLHDGGCVVSMVTAASALAGHFDTFEGLEVYAAEMAPGTASESEIELPLEVG